MYDKVHLAVVERSLVSWQAENAKRETCMDTGGNEGDKTLDLLQSQAIGESL